MSYGYSKALRAPSRRSTRYMLASVLHAASSVDAAKRHAECCAPARARLRQSMDFNNPPAGDALPACPASYEGSVDMAPQEAQPLGTPTRRQCPWTGAHSARRRAAGRRATFRRPLAHGGRRGRRPDALRRRAGPHGRGAQRGPPKPLTPPARAPMALTPPLPPTAPMDAAPTAAAARWLSRRPYRRQLPWTPRQPLQQHRWHSPPAVPPSAAMDAAPTAASAPMAPRHPRRRWRSRPPAPRAASDAAPARRRRRAGCDEGQAR